MIAPIQRRSFARTSLGALAFTAARPLSLTTPPPALKEIAAGKNLLFGTAVSFAELQRAECTALLIEQCSILVSENDMKWGTIHPEPDRFDFSRADRFMAFAEENRIAARGHNLCWYKYNPKWLDSTINPQNAATILREHIRTVAGRYAGRIHSWDVLNEAVQPGGARPYDLRPCVWLDTLGEEYVEVAFRAAAEADPKALLTYNDYDIEEDTPDQEKKREAVLEFLHRLRKKQVPVQALGVQSHLKPQPQPSQWKGLNKFLEQIKKLGLQVYVTELDVDDSKLPAAVELRDQAVAAVYANYLRNMLQHPSVEAVLTWGFTDRDSWLNGFRPRADGLSQRPLPFDESLRPTPAFFALRDALSSR